MKKLVSFFKKPVVAGVVVGLAIASGAANADVKFYAGAGLDYAKIGMSKEAKDEIGEVRGVIKSKGMGLLMPIIGVRFHDNFGVEMGYSFNRKISVKFPNVPKASLKVRNTYVDLMGFVPVMDQFELIGGLGLGKLMLKKDKNTEILTVDKIKNKFGLRAKLGAQYNFTNNFGVRALVTYQKAANKADEEKMTKSMTSIGMAATYTI